MEALMPALLPLAIFGVVGSLIVILWLVLGRSSNSQSRALSERVAEYATVGAAHAEEEKAARPSILERLGKKSTDGAASAIKGTDWPSRLGGALTQAGMKIKPEEFIILMLCCAVAGGAVLFVLTGGIAGIFLGGFFGFVAPVLMVRIKIGKRNSQFLSELPDMLQSLAAGLTAGASLPQALEGVAMESQGAMNEELNRVIIDTRLGASIPDALEQCADRMNCTDFSMVTMAIRMQATHGGNLADLLTTVAGTLRERVQMTRHVKALSAEGRLSLGILMALPLLMMGAIFVMRRDYFNFYLSKPGLIMIGGICVMMLCGFLWGRSIVKVEV